MTHTTAPTSPLSTTRLQRLTRLTGALLAAAGLLAGVAAASVTPAAAAGDCTVSSADIGLNGEETNLLNTINTYRQQNGLAALTADATLSKASLWASGDSAKRGFAPSNHIDTLGRDIPTRVKDCGYSTFTWINENNYYGYGTKNGIDLAGADGAFDFWRNSPGHNANMLEAKVKYAGVARVCAGATCFFTLNLGSNAGGAAFPGGAPGGMTPATPALNVPLVRVGDTGETVKTIQYLLRQNGATIEADGIFGPLTLAAVRAFQQQKGLQVDGIVGPQTFGALFVTVQQGSQGEAVRALQSQLNARGETLNVDGIFGPLTLSAVRSYQQKAGLAVDGIVGPQTWSALVSKK
jgi:peptidoglycan hydrolase-like protein with peptidoglycan-binding domain